MQDGRVVRRGRGSMAIEVQVDASDVFNDKERKIMEYILRRTPKDLRDEIGEYYGVADARVIQIIGKILHKINCDGMFDENNKGC